MATDNRTTINNCSAITGWTGDDSVTVVTDTGLQIEGGSALSTQLSNADEHMYTTSIGAASIDMTDVTVFCLIKDNLVDTQANGGYKIVIGDGTDRIGFEVGGYDNAGLQTQAFFSSLKLDVSNRGALTGHVFAGSVANLTVSSITQVGYGSLHLSKAQGSIDNVFMDRFSYIANTSYAMTINGGTSGTPETFSDVVTDDETNGWGMISNPVGSLYQIFASTEFGTTAAADSYFEDSSFQLFLLGGDQGAGNFIFRTAANSGQTHSLSWRDASIINTGSRAVIDFTDTNFDTIDFVNVTFTNCGAISFPGTNSVTRTLDGLIFNNCDIITFGSTTANNCTINGSTRALGALSIDQSDDVRQQENLTFNSDGTGHAYELVPTGAGPFTFEITGWTYTGYASTNGSTGNEVVYINPGTSSADITINIDGGGDTPTYRTAAGYTGTLTINNNVSVTLTGMRDGTEVRVCDQSNPPVELAGIETVTAGTADNRSFTFSLSAGTVVDITVMNNDFILPPNNRIENYTIPSSAASIPISQTSDRVYSNP